MNLFLGSLFDGVIVINPQRHEHCNLEGKKAQWEGDSRQVVNHFCRPLGESAVYELRSQRYTTIAIGINAYIPF